MKRLLLVFLLLAGFTSLASHIVGGEIELIHLPNGPDGIERFRYQINLIYYYDSLHAGFANPGTVNERFVRVYIFRKNATSPADTIRSVVLPFSNISHVAYSQSICSKAQVVATQKVVYSSAPIVLSPDTYKDPEGYYIAWERCCRNYQIVNIFSDDPDKPGDITPAGQTFYLEFPPVVKNGQPFINSSPQNFPPLRDYACPQRRYYADFAGIDVDGDSLVYSKVEPISTVSAQAIPPITNAPYPPVTWRPPYGIDNIFGGHPDFVVSRDGFITVTPGSVAGLFVFAVKCEEFRNGVKIGETRRDFQLNVSTSCPVASSPEVTVRKLGGGSYSTPNQPAYIEFQNNVSDADRCIEIKVYDPDILKSSENFKERITNLQIIPINFDQNLDGLLPVVRTFDLEKGGQEFITFKICFPDCPYVDGPFQLGIAAYDDACPQPLGDTLYVTVNVVPPDNAKPVFSPASITETVPEGAQKTWIIKGSDADGDKLINGIVPVGFNLSDYGMTYTVLSDQNNTPGLFEAELKWDAACDKFNRASKTKFLIQLSLEDIDHCNFDQPSFMNINLTLDDGHHDPEIFSPTANRSDTITVVLTSNSNIAFDVKASDVDTDLLVLSGRGKDFNLNDYGVTFTQATGSGLVSSPFAWNIKCNTVNLDEKDEFDFEFIVVDDQNLCHIYRADTLDYVIRVKPPENNKPSLKAINNKTNQLVTDTLSITLGNDISLTLQGTDQDLTPVDFLTMELAQATGDVEPVLGYTFVPNNSTSPANASFNWMPDCSIFKNGIYENRYAFMFKVSDGRCLTPLADTTIVYVKVSDVASDDKNFNPPNVITPDNDGCNDYFALEGFESSNPECPPIADDLDSYVGLPKDNCIRRFESIRIYNRWGGLVYTSQQRNFRWYAKDAGMGVYYYYIKYTDKVYKGALSVLF